MIDIDHFKPINDSYGHGVGDQVLCDFANRMRRASRYSDILIRWGGEEFVSIFPETTLVQAMNIAERMRESVSDEPFATFAGPLHLTISLGVATLSPEDDSQSLIHRADQAMYVAKNQGRNRAVALSTGAQIKTLNG
jgi:two-component system cell cycle response regulator